MSAQRKARVEHALRDVLTELLPDIKDPRVREATLVTFTKVEMNVDLAVANVYVSVVGDDATRDNVVAGLTKAAGFLRGPAARRLSLQRAPELRFFADQGLDISDKLAAIVREDEDKARAAGRDPKRPLDAASSSTASSSTAPQAAPSSTALDGSSSRDKP